MKKVCYILVITFSFLFSFPSVAKRSGDSVCKKLATKSPDFALNGVKYRAFIGISDEAYAKRKKVCNIIIKNCESYDKGLLNCSNPAGKVDAFELKGTKNTFPVKTSMIVGKKARGWMKQRLTIPDALVPIDVCQFAPVRVKFALTERDPSQVRFDRINDGTNQCNFNGKNCNRVFVSKTATYCIQRNERNIEKHFVFHHEELTLEQKTAILGVSEKSMQCKGPKGAISFDWNPKLYYTEKVKITEKTVAGRPVKLKTPIYIDRDEDMTWRSMEGVSDKGNVKVEFHKNQMLKSFEIKRDRASFYGFNYQKWDIQPDQKSYRWRGEQSGGIVRTETSGVTETTKPKIAFNYKRSPVERTLDDVVASVKACCGDQGCRKKFSNGQPVIERTLSSVKKGKKSKETAKKEEVGKAKEKVAEKEAKKKAEDKTEVASATSSESSDPETEEEAKRDPAQSEESEEPTESEEAKKDPASEVEAEGTEEQAPVDEETESSGGY